MTATLGTPADSQERLLSTEELAEFLGITTQRIHDMRYKGIGPPAIKLGHRTLRFRLSEVEAWLEDRAEGSP